MEKKTLKSQVAEIKAEIATSVEYVEKAILLLASRQTEDEVETRDTKHRNYRGFSSSNAHWGTTYALQIASGEHLTGEHLERARRICTFHARQLAKAQNEV